MTSMTEYILPYVLASFPRFRKYVVERHYTRFFRAKLHPIAAVLSAHVQLLLVSHLH